jgi:hypothetical protein
MAPGTKVLASLTFAASLTLCALGKVSTYTNYSTVTGYFLQDLPSTDPSTFNFVSVSPFAIGMSSIY